MRSYLRPKRTKNVPPSRNSSKPCKNYYEARLLQRAISRHIFCWVVEREDGWHVESVA